MSVMEAVAKTTFADLTFEEKLDRLAEVAVKVGLGLRAGQELIMSAPMEALPLVRRITEHAYKAGALLVTTFYADDPSVLARFEYGGGCELRLCAEVAAGRDCRGFPEWRGEAGDCGN